MTESDNLPVEAVVEGEVIPPLVARFPGVLNLGGSDVDVYVLDNGDRVISLRGVVRAIAETDSGNLGSYLAIEPLKSFINSDLILGETREFTIPGTQFRGKGITAEHFETILTGYARALAAGALKTDRQRQVAIRCAILSTAFLRIGIIAQIDEATGYQSVREEDALQVKLRAFIAEELRAWEKTFPDELWQQFGRLTGWKGALHSRPKWWGKLVIELIYDTLDPEVAKYLKDNKPPSGSGIRWHQQLTESYGVRQLVSRCYEIIGIAKTCCDMIELRQKVAENYSLEPVQLTLFLPKRRN